jgi:purine-binding chemotaxis protein CheW
MQSNQAVHAENTVTLGCFDVGGRSCALDVSQIREVVRWSAPTPLPDAPGLIDGVLDLRGSIVPVIDLGRALGLAAVKPGLISRIAVVEVDGMVLGLAVQAALEVVAVDVARLEDPPALATQAGYDLARAIVRRAKAEPMVVLSLEQVLERVYRSALADGERDR